MACGCSISADRWSKFPSYLTVIYSYRNYLLSILFSTFTSPTPLSLFYLEIKTRYASIAIPAYSQELRINLQH